METQKHKPVTAQCTWLYTAASKEPPPITYYTVSAIVVYIIITIKQ